jgi:hypothetical protein
MYRRLLITVLAVGVLVIGTASLVVAGNGPLAGDLERVRGALARYNSVAQAERDGYVPTSPCEASPAGAMGIHYLNPALLAPGTDPLQPEILVYLPGENGKLKLVAAEYMSIDADQDVATADDRPSVFGQPFDGPMLGHAPGMPIHYDLHVWLFEANPTGVFAQWNPALSCPS